MKKFGIEVELPHKDKGVATYSLPPMIAKSYKALRKELDSLGLWFINIISRVDESDTKPIHKLM